MRTSVDTAAAKAYFNSKRFVQVMPYPETQ
jgi:hypothetical protein